MTPAYETYIFPATLRKVRSTHSYLRTDEVRGAIPFLPKRGERLTMYAPGLTDTALTRLITTTEIQDLRELSPGEYEFTTANSTYRLTVDALLPDKIELRYDD